MVHCVHGTEYVPEMANTDESLLTRLSVKIWMVFFEFGRRVCSIIDIIHYVNGIGNLSRDQYIRTRTPCYSLHHFVLSNSIATKPKNGQKPLQLRTYRVIAAKQKQFQGSFELIPVKEYLLYT